VEGPREYPDLFRSPAAQFIEVEPILYRWTAEQNLETLQWLYNITGQLDEEAANAAVVNDKLEVLKWLTQQGVFPV
jgi:hypothetical protein